MCAFALASCGGSSDSSSPKTTAQTQPAPTATAPTPTVTVPTVTTPKPKTTTTQTSTTPAPKPPPSADPGKTKRACGNVAGNFIKHIQTDVVPCNVARAVAQGWLTQVQKGSNPAQPITVSGYTCFARFRGELAAVSCDDRADPRRARIVFSGQP